MTIPEFSNEFDVLYNNIMSNAAPGLNEYEKSVFLTKAQEEIIFNYFNPKGNKYGEGFDDSVKRQMDFSELIKSDFLKLRGIFGTDASGKIMLTFNANNNYYFIIQQIYDTGPSSIVYSSGVFTFYMDWTDTVETLQATLNATLLDHNLDDVIVIDSLIWPVGMPENMPFPELAIKLNRGYDVRSIVYHLPKDVLFIINESVLTEDPKAIHQVVPLKFEEYQRLMSKPFKEPLKNQMWRLVSDSTNESTLELIPHSGDIIQSYMIRYVKRPNPIILTNLTTVYDGLTINGKSTVTTKCELNPIVHRAILDRAVELAKAAYVGDLKSTVELNARNE